MKDYDKKTKIISGWKELRVLGIMWSMWLRSTLGGGGGGAF